MSKCIRCGKDRITLSSYKQVISNSEIVYTTTVCSDPECQKMVDKTLKQDEAKMAVQKIEQEQRAQQRLALKKQRA